jgi:EAL and modified HD-GYP domain-containing signal transduction protein
MNTLLARQPILDRTKRVFGYELLYRSPDGRAFLEGGADDNHATAHVIVNSLLTLNLDKLVMGKRAFINFNRDMLVGGFGKLLPRALVVIEVLETVVADEEVIAACKDLKQAGYTIALDDYTTRAESLIHCADIVKIDVRDRGVVSPESVIPRLETRGVKVLAEKVETQEEFLRARQLGYAYFQGFFFARPSLVTGSDLSVTKVHYHRLLEAVQGSSLDYRKIEDVIRQEVSFTYKLLRYINSAKFSWRGRVESIRQALMLLADDEVRRWAMLLLLYGMGRDKPAALVVLALSRARFCELLASAIGRPERGPKLFLVGMFSLLDAIMNQDLNEAVRDLPLDQEVISTLLNRDSGDETLSAIYHLVRSYELGDWTKVLAESQHLHISDDVLSPLYAESVQWAENVFGA